jgi:hypothetical protein
VKRPLLVVHRRPRVKLLPKPPSEWLPRERTEPMPKGKPNPLAFAQFWLGPRLEERGDSFYLDGRPVKLDQVMQAANRAARSSGQEMVTPNPNWMP